MKNFLKFFGMGGAALFFAFVANAGDVAGNSCKTIICFKDASVLKQILARELEGSPQYGLIRDIDISQIESIETLDLHEARLEDLRFPKRGKIFPQRAGESEWEWIDRVRSRFSSQFPFIHKLIPARDTLFDQILIANQSVAPVDDAKSAWVYEPSFCTTVTTALQRQIGQFGRIQLDGRLYRHPKMSNLSRAVLMLHESIYYAQLHQFHLPPPPEPENSAPTRALIGLLIQDNLSATPTVGSLIDEIQKIGFSIKWADIHPVLAEDFHDKALGTLSKVFALLADQNKDGDLLRPEYRSPFEKFRRDFDREAASVRGFSLPYGIPTLNIFEEILKNSLATNLISKKGDCTQWGSRLECISRAGQSRPLPGNARALVQKYLDRVPQLRIEQNEGYAKIKSSFQEQMKTLADQDFPAQLFADPAYAANLNEELHTEIRRLYAEFWTDVIFRGDAAFLEEIEHTARNKAPTALGYEAINSYVAFRNYLLGRIRAQTFEVETP